MKDFEMSLTELDKLKTAASLIRDISLGKLEMVPSDLGFVYIRTSDDAYIALDMVMRNNLIKGYMDVTFQSHVRRMGGEMCAKDLVDLQREVQQAHALLLALEIAQFHPSHSDLTAFHEYLVQEQKMKAQAEQAQSLTEQSM